jgi:hypothetical protein
MIFRRLTGPVSFSGAGLHSGVSGMVTVVPGTEGYRVTLRTEKEAFPIEKCRFTGTGRGTEVFLPDGSSLKTPEHLFSALSGLGIWSAAISADALRSMGTASHEGTPSIRTSAQAMLPLKRRAAAKINTATAPGFQFLLVRLSVKQDTVLCPPNTRTVLRSRNESGTPFLLLRDRA